MGVEEFEGEGVDGSELVNSMRVLRVGHFTEFSALPVDPPFCHLASPSFDIHFNIDINAWLRSPSGHGLICGISGLQGEGYRGGYTTGVEYWSILMRCG